MSAPGIRSLQRREHLAAVAHAEGEGVVPRAKKAANSSRARALKRIDLGPALAGPEHIAVGKSAAGDQTMETASDARPRKQSVMCTSYGVEAGAGEHRRHLDLAVDPLFAQHRNRGPRAARDVRCRNILRRIEA